MAATPAVATGEVTLLATTVAQTEISAIAAQESEDAESRVASAPDTAAAATATQPEAELENALAQSEAAEIALLQAEIAALRASIADKDARKAAARASTDEYEA